MEEDQICDECGNNTEECECEEDEDEEQQIRQDTLNSKLARVCDEL